jgi:hypothetical protein
MRLFSVCLNIVEHRSFTTKVTCPVVLRFVTLEVHTELNMC